MIGRLHVFAQSALSSLGGVDDGGGDIGSSSFADYRQLITELTDTLKWIASRGQTSLTVAKIAMVIEGRTTAGELTHEYRSVWPVYQVRDDYWKKEDVVRRKIGYYTRTLYVSKSGKLLVLSSAKGGAPGAKYSEDFSWADVTPRILESRQTELSVEELSDLLTGVKAIIR